MPTKILSAHKFTKIRYGGPKRSYVQVKVESNAPVNVYGVTAENLDGFRSNHFYDLFKYAERTDIDKRIHMALDANDDWYLIIENRSGDAVAIHYEVFDV
jgi:hypothetical protein